MNVTINGVKKTYEAPLSIKIMLTQEGYADMKVAVARNGVFIAKGDYDSMINESDEIEIVAPMQGG